MQEINGESSESAENSCLTIPIDILVEHALATEFAEVCRLPIDGVFVAPRNENRFAWNGVIFVRKGLFGGGIFRFELKFPIDFPTTTALPIVTFEKSIFHPAICKKSNVLDISRSFPDGWKREKHNIRRVLVVLQRSFYSIDADSENCANPEAAVLYKENRNKFREIVTENVSTSRASVYDEPTLDSSDSNCIKLLPWDATVHTPTRERMIRIGMGAASGSNGAGTAAEFRNEKLCETTGIRMAETVGRGYPKSYSWFDPTVMTVVTLYDQMVDFEAEDSKTSAREDREKYGIEPLDLRSIDMD